MFKRALFAMEVVCSLPMANSCTSLEKVSILSAGEFMDCWFKKSILILSAGAGSDDGLSMELKDGSSRMKSHW